MLPETQAANTLLQTTLSTAWVESFGLSHQFLFLEFRDDAGEDHQLNIDTEVTSNYFWEEQSTLSEEERVLLLFHKVNLKRVVHVACDDEANLVLRFENGIELRLAGLPAQELAEPWTLGNTPFQKPGGYLLRAFTNGTYDIWHYPF